MLGLGGESRLVVCEEGCPGSLCCLCISSRKQAGPTAHRGVLGDGPSQVCWREGLTWTLAVSGQVEGPSGPCSRCCDVHPDSLPEPQHPPPAAGNTCSQRLSSSLGHRHTPGPWSLPP